MIALKFTSEAHILATAKLLGLVDPSAAALPASSTLTFTPSAEIVAALGIAAPPAIEAIYGTPYRMRLIVIPVEYWVTGATETIIDQGGGEELVRVRVPVHHRVNIDPMDAPAFAVAFLQGALANAGLVISDDDLAEQGDRITTW